MKMIGQTSRKTIMQDKIVSISVDGKSYSIPCSANELALLHGCIRAIMDQDFDWFSSEDKRRALEDIDAIFNQ
jgi:hypothetical protein